MSAGEVRLGQLAITRSGDKGNHANLGVVARSQADYEFLRAELTTARVAKHFAGLGTTRVERFELPRIWAFNFLLYDCLAGGGSRSLRIDSQGKLLGTSAQQIALPARTRAASRTSD
jgi:hypothetical protein